MFYILTSAVRNTKEVELWHPAVQVPDTGWDDQHCLELLFPIHLGFSPLRLQQCFLPGTSISLYPLSSMSQELTNYSAITLKSVLKVI